jgi:hypothetical protein
MHDFKYGAVISKWSEWEALLVKIGDVRTPALKMIAAAFDFNVRRFTGFAAMPMELAFHARRDQRFTDQAIFEMTGKLPDWAAPEGKVTRTPELSAALDIEAEKFERLSQSEKVSLKTGWGWGQVEHMLKRGDAGMMASIDALYSSMILEAWTAFECLAGDLWVVGVDLGPGEIVARLIGANRRLRQPDDNIRPETVYRSGIDPKKNYGSFLRAVNCVSFQRLSDIRHYYAIAFERPVARLFDEIESGYIAALSAFRNVITHAAGLADKEFIEKIARFTPEFDLLKERDFIALDGELVRKLTMVSASLGAALLSQIDDVLSPPP